MSGPAVPRAKNGPRLYRTTVNALAAPRVSRGSVSAIDEGGIMKTERLPVLE